MKNYISLLAGFSYCTLSAVNINYYTSYEAVETNKPTGTVNITVTPTTPLAEVQEKLRAVAGAGTFRGCNLQPKFAEIKIAEVDPERLYKDYTHADTQATEGKASIDQLNSFWAFDNRSKKGLPELITKVPGSVKVKFQRRKADGTFEEAGAALIRISPAKTLNKVQKELRKLFGPGDLKDRNLPIVDLYPNSTFQDLYGNEAKHFEEGLVYFSARP